MVRLKKAADGHRRAKEGEMKFRVDGTNLAIMDHNRNEQMSDSVYREADRDIMNKYAMLQRGADFCPNCSNFLTPLSWEKKECQECGKKLH